MASSRQLSQPRKPVLPSMNTCRPRSASGAASVSRSLSGAEHHADHHAGQQQAQRVLCAARQHQRQQHTAQARRRRPRPPGPRATACRPPAGPGPARPACRRPAPPPPPATRPRPSRAGRGRPAGCGTGPAPARRPGRASAPVSQAPSVRGARIWPTISAASGPCSSCMKPAQRPAVAARRQPGQQQQHAGRGQRQQQPAAPALGHRASLPSRGQAVGQLQRGLAHARPRAHQHLVVGAGEGADLPLLQGAQRGPAGALRHASRRLRASAITMSGCARTTNSGLSFGNGPSAAGTMLRRPKRCQRLADEGLRPGRIGRGLDLEVDAASAQRGRHACRGLGQSALRSRARPPAPRPVSPSSVAQHLQVVLHVLVAARVQHDAPCRPSACSRCTARADGAASTRSGLSAAMRSTCASSRPPSLGSAGHLGRPVGIAVGADQPRAGAQRADAFGQPGHQADDALRRCGAGPGRQQQASRQPAGADSALVERGGSLRQSPRPS